MKIIKEKEAEQLLSKNGFNIIESRFIKNKNQLKKVKLDFPWIAKVISPEIVHKFKAGGIIFNINSVHEAYKAYDKLKKLKGAKGILIQSQLKEKGQQIILGLKKTEEFGLVIMVGKGGTHVEEDKDVSFRMIPINNKEAKNMIDDLKINIDNKKDIIKNLFLLQKFANKNPKIQELDINPIILTKKGGVIVDARLVI